MSKRQWMDAILPVATVGMMFVCGALGCKGRWMSIIGLCLVWLIFASWMLYGH